MIGAGWTPCKSSPFPIFPDSWCGSVQIRLSWWTFTVLKGEWRKSARVRVMNWEATQLLSFFQEVSQGSMNLLEFTWELPIHPAAELCLHNPEETTWFPFVEASTATHPFPTVYQTHGSYGLVGRPLLTLLHWNFEHSQSTPSLRLC